MVDKVYEIKNKLIEHIQKMADERGGIERVNTSELTLYVDMVKDLAEAEEKCWKAEYYRTVTEAMGEGKSGYTSQGGGTGSSAGYGSYGSRMGYGTQGMQQGGQGGRRGYGNMSGHHEVTALVERLEMASPDEKEHIKNELRMKGVM